MQERRPPLDGLRGIAILLVVFYHFHVPGSRLRRLEGGWCGVDLFFVLSGFLITSLLIQEREGTGSISFRRFYRRRWKRLGPPVVFMLAVAEMATSLVTWPGSGGYGIGKRVTDLGALLSLNLNWARIGGFQLPPFMDSMWSLAVEEQFYLLWPLVLFLAYRRRTHHAARRLLLLVAAGGTAVSALECAALYPHHHDQIRIYFGTDTRAQGLFVGIIVALIWVSGRRLAPRESALLGSAGALSLGVVAWMIDDTSAFRANGCFTILAAATGFTLLHVLWEPQSTLSRALSWPPLRWAGLRSYAIYLWHAPIALFLNISQNRPTGPTRWGWPGYIGGITLSFALAELSWHLVEHRRTRQARAPGAEPALEAVV